MPRPTHDEVATERRAPTVAHGVGYVLRVLEGADARRSLQLDPSRPARWLVGKSPSCDLVLGDAQVSRRHAAFELSGLRLGVTDLGSTNGTFVNDVAVASAYLSGGEVVRVGSTLLRVELSADASPGDAADTPAFGRMVGTSPRMRVVYTLAARLAASDVPLVIEGETGAGKELLAECIHEASARAPGTFVVFDASATPSEAAATTLFGNAARGTPGLFEAAHGGTLFLDEAADLDVDTQGALLRAIERGEVRRVGEAATRHVSVRTIAATQRDLDKLVEEGRFREDLFFRLAVGRIELPPLRRRGEDVLSLARHFWRRLSGAGELPEAFLDRYTGYDWPGNVRELANALARMAALGPSASLVSARVGSTPRSADEGSEDVIARVLATDLAFPQARQQVLDAFERAYVERVLAKHGGNVARAAAASGIARRYFQLIRARQAR